MAAVYVGVKPVQSLAHSTLLHTQLDTSWTGYSIIKCSLTSLTALWI